MADEKKHSDEKPLVASQSGETSSQEPQRKPSLNRRDFAVAGITGLAALATAGLVTHSEQAAQLKSRILDQIKKDIGSSKDTSTAALTYDKGTVTHDRFVSYA